VIATALVSSVGDPSQFRNGRQFAAWLGLTPRQKSSGGKTRLGGITKRGDTYLRTLLVQDARAVMHFVNRRDDRHSRWIKAVMQAAT
jgi:transposase